MDLLVAAAASAMPEAEPEVAEPEATEPVAAKVPKVEVLVAVAAAVGQETQRGKRAAAVVATKKLKRWSAKTTKTKTPPLVLPKVDRSNIVKQLLVCANNKDNNKSNNKNNNKNAEDDGGSGGGAPAYMRVQHPQVSELDDPKFNKTILGSALARGRRDQQLPKGTTTTLNMTLAYTIARLQVVDLGGAAASPKKRRRESSEDDEPEEKVPTKLRPYDQGPFIAQTYMADTAVLRRLLVFDLYAAAHQKRDFMLFMCVDSRYFLDMASALGETPHFFRSMRYPGIRLAKTYICLDATFVSAPSKVSLADLVHNEALVKELLIDKTVKDSFFVEISSTTMGQRGNTQPQKRCTIPVDLADLVDGRLVQGYAPLADRGIHLCDFISATRRGAARNVAVAALLQELVGDSVQSYEVVDAYKTLETRAIRRLCERQSILVAELRSRIKELKPPKPKKSYYQKVSEKYIGPNGVLYSSSDQVLKEAATLPVENDSSNDCDDAMMAIGVVAKLPTGNVIQHLKRVATPSVAAQQSAVADDSKKAGDDQKEKGAATPSRVAKLSATVGSKTKKAGDDLNTKVAAKQSEAKGAKEVPATLVDLHPI